MDLTSKRTIKQLFRKYHFRPSKRLGQYFLISKSVLKKIIEAASLNLKDVVIEIGPGMGTLTEELAKRAKKVVAIEKDAKMCEVLKETLKDFKNVEVIQEDILAAGFRPLPANYKVVANLPYYITSPVIRKFLEAKNPPVLMVLMVQKEIAKRICSEPPRMSLLSVSVQFYAKPQVLSYVSKKSFWPQPKVDSAIIKLKVKSSKLKVDKDLFFNIVKAGFSHPRKQIINNLSKGLSLSREKVKIWLEKNKISPTQRAETLSVNDWKHLTRSI